MTFAASVRVRLTMDARPIRLDRLDGPRTIPPNHARESRRGRGVRTPSLHRHRQMQLSPDTVQVSPTG